MGTAYAANLLNRECGPVSKKAKRMGLICDQSARYKRHGDILSSRNESCDVHFFDRGWSEDMSYILGYIFADGCIAKNLYYLGFLCHSKDEQILLAIHKTMKVTNKIHRHPGYEFTRNGKLSKPGPRTSFNVTSKVLVASLMSRFGLRPRKTYLNIPMPEVPIKYFGHFLRGYFDGDGCISKSRTYKGDTMSMIGGGLFISQIQKQICDITDVLANKVRQEGEWTSTIGWSDQRDLRKLYECMYPEGEYIHLTRKREIFNVIINQNIKHRLRTN